MASKIKDDDNVSSAFWKIFIDILIDEVKKENMGKIWFSDSSWTRIAFETCKRGGRYVSTMVMQQKFIEMRKNYLEFSLLLSQPGFVWDSETNTVHATKETLKNYIQANPNGEKFRTKGLAAYKSLDVIFNFSTPTGIVHRATPFTQAPIIIDEADELDNNKEVNPARPKRYRITQSGARPKRYRMTQSGEGSCTPSRYSYTINKCMAVLNDLEGVSDDAYSKVLKLFKDAYWREMFMNIPQERKLGWLERL